MRQHEECKGCNCATQLQGVLLKDFRQNLYISYISFQIFSVSWYPFFPLLSLLDRFPCRFCRLWFNGLLCAVVANCVAAWGMWRMQLCNPTIFHFCRFWYRFSLTRERIFHCQLKLIPAEFDINGNSLKLIQYIFSFENDFVLSLFIVWIIALSRCPWPSDAVVTSYCHFFLQQRYSPHDLFGKATKDLNKGSTFVILFHFPIS